MQYGLMGNYSVSSGMGQDFQLPVVQRIPIGEVQRLLRSLGECISVDGRWGSQTRTALERAAGHVGLPASHIGNVTGAGVELTGDLIARLRLGRAWGTCPAVGRRAPTPTPTPAVPGGKPVPGGELITEVRQAAAGVPWWVWLIVAGAGTLALYTGATAIRKRGRRKPKRRQGRRAARAAA